MQPGKQQGRDCGGSHGLRGRLAQGPGIKRLHGTAVGLQEEESPFSNVRVCAGNPMTTVWQ